MHLIDEIAANLKCQYVSDIADGRMSNEKILLATKMIAENAHDMAEWNEAVKYITGYNSLFNTEAEAREFFEKNTKDKNV